MAVFDNGIVYHLIVEIIPALVDASRYASGFS
jgi:hypothetical protein